MSVRQHLGLQTGQRVRASQKRVQGRGRWVEGAWSGGGGGERKYVCLQTLLVPTLYSNRIQVGDIRKTRALLSVAFGRQKKAHIGCLK